MFITTDTIEMLRPFYFNLHFQSRLLGISLAGFLNINSERFYYFVKFVRLSTSSSSQIIWPICMNCSKVDLTWMLSTYHILGIVWYILLMSPNEFLFWIIWDRGWYWRFCHTNIFMSSFATVSLCKCWGSVYNRQVHAPFRSSFVMFRPSKAV
jgi:hypothetical protein